ncbi:MAG: ABC transporter permease, partial [Candidatus Zixiibacteriota bacterium]
MRRAFAGLVKKEFIQVFRDPNMLRIIFLVPLVQLILFGYVVNTEVKRIALDVYDFDRSQLSHQLVDAFQAGEYFVPNLNVLSLMNLEDRFKDGTAEMALIIPQDFSERMIRGGGITLGLLTDGSNSNAALIGQGYAAQIVQKFALKQISLRP